jgi:CheY-like chemotaxis protein
MPPFRILLVEDNQDNLEFMRFLLEREGYAVLEAQNGEQCLAQVRAQRPDLVLMDLTIPIIDGWQAAKILRDDLDTRDIPLIAVTAHTLPGDRRRALEIGFDNYISKPINVPVFYGVIEGVLKDKKPVE